MARSKRIMMKHQADAYDWAKHRRTIGLFHEMRLGKTMPTIRWANRRVGAKKVLVACPMGAIDSWVRELKLEGEDPVVLTGSFDQRAKALLENEHKRWFIINYEGLRKSGNKTRTGKTIATPSAFAELPWDLIIADESTRVRNPKSAITQVFLGWLSQAKYKALLTGLPNPEGPEDFVTQMLFLRRNFMGCRTFWDWRAKHMQPVGFDWTVKHKSMLLLREAVEEHCQFLTRKQAGMGEKKVYERRDVELPAKIKRAMAIAERDFEIGNRLAVNKLQIMTWCAQLAGGRYPDESLHHDVKIREVLDLAKGELKGEPLIVWCRFTAEIHALAEAFKKNRFKVEVVTGETPRTNGEKVRRFQRGKVTVLLAQTKCLQMGVDLSRSSTMIYYSNWADFEVRSQSEDRIIHPKKSKDEPLLIMDIVCKDTVDEDMIGLLQDKKINAGNFRRQFLKRFMERVDRRRAA